MPSPINQNARDTHYLVAKDWPILADPAERRAIAARAVPFLLVGPDPTGFDDYHAALSVEGSPQLRELADRIRVGAMTSHPGPGLTTSPVLIADARHSSVTWWRTPIDSPVIVGDVLIHLDGQDYRFALFWPEGVSVLPMARRDRPGPDGRPMFALVLAIYGGDHLPFPPLAIIYVPSKPFPTPVLNVAEYLDAKAPPLTELEKSLGV